MARLGRSVVVVVLASSAGLVQASWAAADLGTGAGGAVSIPAGAPAVTSGPADPYPATVTLSGVGGTIVDVEVGLNGFSHTFLDDLVIVLEDPDGATVALVNQCGGADDALGVDVVFADGGLSWADGTSGGSLSANTYAPTTCSSPVDVPAPGPAGPYGTTFASLTGGDPNGDWHLWVFDSSPGDSGALSGWTLDVTTTNSPPAAGDGSFSTPVDTTLANTLAPLASDIDGDSPLTFAVAAPPTAGVLVLAADGTFTYTPDTGFVGTDTFTYTVDDGVPEEVVPAAVSAPGTVTITVTPIQVSTTTTTTATTAPPSTTTSTPSSTTTARAVLARTGVDRGSAAGGGAASIVVGVLLIGASTVLVDRSRRWRHLPRRR